jgi:catechol 2,3-dioxygenase-like lactoylglutathione lyase family enzyme
VDHSLARALPAAITSSKLNHPATSTRTGSTVAAAGHRCAAGKEILVAAVVHRATRPRGGCPVSSTDSSIDLAAAERERARIRDAHLKPADDRPASTARGLHHTALISSDVERTVRFYQDVLGFPLTELIENRDYPGSSHFFFDIGNGNLVAFFDFPGLDVGPYAEVLGGLHHMAISVEPSRWAALVKRLEEAGVEHVVHSGVSVYFRDPDGARIELIADPLGEMYGQHVL